MEINHTGGGVKLRKEGQFNIHSRTSLGLLDYVEYVSVKGFV